MQVLVEPLKYILNISLEQGNFPKLLKRAEVCPIFKENDKRKCENYRPISLLSNISKLFERAMHNRIYDFLESSDILYNLQLALGKNIYK